MDEVKRMYCECMEYAHSAIDRLDRYLMVNEHPVIDTAQRLVDSITENLMQMIAGGVSIREETMIDEEYIEEATLKVELAHDAEADLQRRGDFFRDELIRERGCPPSRYAVACASAGHCPYGIEEDDVAAWKQCWEAVWEAQW